jgi:putative endonuclease
MTFYVYIIFSATLDKFYIGCTSNLEKRLIEHNQGISIFTSKASDWILKYSKSFDTRELAMKREKEIKNKKSRKYVEWLIKNNT